ncbi:MAG: NAD(P)H-dependent oxidoreductase [Pseudomonadota bacterium]
MSKKIFVWTAHPSNESLCAALADAYASAARAAGATVRTQNLEDMAFDASGFPDKKAEVEPDLALWRENILWADHILVVHPYWWGAMPGRAKAVLDRALTSGFGYKYHSRGLGWDKLLTGRTGDAIITSDTPPIIDTLIYRSPGRRVIRNQVFAFCGIKPRAIVQMGPVKTASEDRIAGYLKRAADLGTKAAKHPHSTAKLIQATASAAG